MSVQFAKVIGLALVLTLAVTGFAAAGSAAVGGVARPAATRPLAAPLYFEPNRARSVDGPEYIARGAGYQVGLDAEGPTLRLRSGQQTAAHAVRWHLLNRQPASSQAEALQSGRSHYLSLDGGKDHRDVPHFARVRYTSVWPGIDVVYYGTGEGELEYDFVVSAGADPDQIAFTVEGAQSLSVAADGALELHTPLGVLAQRAPVIYQEVDGQRIPVDGHFVVDGDTVRFALADYDRALALTIDPVLVWSSFVGDNADDQVFDVAERDGFVYVTGRTLSSNFPTQNPLDPSHGGDADCFISKFAEDGGGLVYSTYLGGVGNDFCNGIAVDADGEAYVVGMQASGAGDAFLVKLSAAGNTLGYPVLLRAGSGLDQAVAIAVTNAGAATVVGFTDSTNFPTTAGTAQVNDGPGRGAFAFRVTSAGALQWSTYLDGAGDQTALGVAIDSGNAAYVAGSTTDLDPSGDGFVIKLNGSGGLVWNSGRLNGNGVDVINDVQVDTVTGEALVTGYTESSDLPTTAGVLQGSYSGDRDAFVGRFNANGNGYVWLTYLGGLRAQTGNALQRDGAGNLYVTGRNDLAEPNGDVFLIKIGPQASNIHYNLQYGGSASDVGNGLAVASNGDAWIGGVTASTDYPTTAGAFDRTKDAGLDGFVMKVGPELTTQTIVQNVVVAGTAGGPNGAVTSPAVTLQPGDLVTVEAVGGTVDFQIPHTANCPYLVGPEGLAREIFTDELNQFGCYPHEGTGQTPAQACAVSDPMLGPNDAHAGLYRPQQAGIGAAKFIGSGSDTFTYGGASNSNLRLGLNDCRGDNNTGQFNVRVTIVRSGNFNVTVPGNAVAGAEVFTSQLKAGDQVTVSGVSGNVNFNTAANSTCLASGVVYNTNANGLPRSVYDDPSQALCYDDGCSDPLSSSVDGHAGLLRKIGSARAFIGLSGAAFTAVANQTLSLGVNDCSGSGSSAPNSGNFTANVTVTRPVSFLSVDAPIRVEGNSGSANLAFTVTLAPASAQTVTVRARTSDRTAIAGSDYSAVDLLLTFTPGQTSNTVNVPILGDPISEPDERFALELINPTAASTAAPRGIGAIVNDDQPSVSISGATCAEGNTGSSACNATVTLSGSASQTVTVNVSTVAGSATAPSDFTALSNQTLTFAVGGPLSQSVPVSIIGDYLIEANETFSMMLSSPTNATLGTASAPMSISNDDAAGTLSVSSGTIDHSESAGAISLVVTRSGGLASGVNVNYAVQPGTATSPADYTVPAGVNGMLIFAGGETSKSVTLNIIDDTVDEDDEAFAFVISSPTGGATLGNANSARQILDNDNPPTLSVDNGGCVVVEGNSDMTPCPFVLRLSAPSAKTVTLESKTATITASGGSDFVAHDWTLRTIPAGQMSTTVDVLVNGDTQVELDERFGLDLRNPVNASLIETRAYGDILNDDGVAGAGALQWAQASYSVDESAGTLTLTVLRSGGSAGAVSIAYATSNGSAQTPDDYTAVSGTLSFADGQSSRTLAITLDNDALDEADENFTVTLSNPTGGATLGSPASATVTIVDDDPTPTVTIHGCAPIVEGDDQLRECLMEVRLSQASGRALSFDYWTEPEVNLIGNVDVQSFELPRVQSVAIIYNTGETFSGWTVQQGPIQVAGPVFDQGHRDQSVFFYDSISPEATTREVQRIVSSTPGTAYRLSLAVSGQQTPPVLKRTDVVWQGAPIGTIEYDATGNGVEDMHWDYRHFDVTSTVASGLLQFIAQFPAGAQPQGGMMIDDVTLTPAGSASPGTDYVQASSSYGEPDLVFAPGTTTLPLIVSIIGDTEVEGDERLRLRVCGDDGACAATLIEIIDDDVPSLSIDGGGCSVIEGNSGTLPCRFVLRVFPASSKAVTFTSATANVTATAGSDYQDHAATPRSLAPGQTTLFIDVPVIADTVDEPNETFRLNITGIQNAVGLDLPGMGTILDDDGAPSLSISDASVIEGDSVTTPMDFMVNLLPASGQQVSVHWATASGTAINGSDYNAGSGWLTFLAGQTSQPVSVAVRGDTVVENDETLYVNLSGAQNAQISDGQGAGTIQDDDLPDVDIFNDGFE